MIVWFAWNIIKRWALRHIRSFHKQNTFSLSSSIHRHWISPTICSRARESLSTCGKTICLVSSWFFLYVHMAHKHFAAWKVCKSMEQANNVKHPVWLKLKGVHTNQHIV